MGPKKKDKSSKTASWLECSLCGKLICPDDAELHSSSCNSSQVFIIGKKFSGKITCAETILDSDGTSIAKGLRDKHNAIWMAVPTMQISGLSIGQSAVVNNVIVKKIWPCKKLALSSIAMTRKCMEEMKVKEGDIMTLERLTWQGHVVDKAILRTEDSQDDFGTEEFSTFASSYLDGVLICPGSPVCIKYFGKVCHAIVDTVELSLPSKKVSNQPHLNLSDAVSHNTSTHETTTSSPVLHPLGFETPPPKTPLNESGSEASSCHQENPSMLSPVLNLSESFASLDVSDVSPFSPGTPQTPAKIPYPNLSTPKEHKRLNRVYLKQEDSGQITFGKIVSAASKIQFKSTDSKCEGENSLAIKELTLEDVFGLSSQIEELKSRIRRAHQPGSSHKCVLLHGPSGTGKTLLVRVLTSDLGLHTVFITGTDLWSKLFGEAESKLREIFKSAKDASPSIVVLDDLDAICPKRTQNNLGQQHHRIVNTLLSLIDELSAQASGSPPVVVVGITNNKSAIDPALRRAGRFSMEVEVGVPTATQRAQILEGMLGHVLHSLASEDITTVARNAHGYVGADLSALVQEACMQAMGKESFADSSPNTQSLNIELKDLVSAGLQVKPSALREIQLEVPQVRWSDIGGMTEVKMRLREAVELPLSHPEIFHNLGIEPPRGLLMYGPPGCSKTMVARAVATECQLNFLAVKGPELFNQYVGESEKAIREVFRKARSAAPSVIFFDEIDAIAGKRGSSSGGSGVDDRVLTQLLTELDGLEYLKDVFIMAATNRPDKIDRALLRPGRFDSLVYVPLPDDTTRQEILEKKLQKMKAAEDVSLEMLVEATLDYSGAEIIQVCQEAALYALREDINTKEVQLRHFESALKKVQPQIDVELLKIYQKFSLSK